jgi:flagellar biosynthesis protein FlhG
VRGDQAEGLRAAAAPAATPAVAAAPGAERMLAVVSGKGGVGKTNLVANLAVAAAGRGRRVLVVDGDLGLANVDVLLGLVPTATVADVLAGRCTLEAALVTGPRGVHVLPAAAGRSELAALGGAGLDALMERLRAAAGAYDLVLIDAGAGVGPTVAGLAAACQRAWLVTTGEPTSLADAYAMLKVLRGIAPGLALELVVNQVAGEGAARRAHAHLARVAARFLGGALAYRGFVPRDARLADAVARQRAVVELFPGASASRQIVALADALLRESAPPLH